MHLPGVSTNALAGLLETLAAPPYDGRADLPPLAAALQMEVDDLFPLAETLQLLRLAELDAGDLRLTPIGREFVEADIDARKRMFADLLVRHVPLVALVVKVLGERTTHRASLLRFVEELDEFMTEDAAEKTLRAVIAWGRYAELFAYDEETRRFSLENPA
jgi:NitT/TauT family transport system ATP-binding protein